MKTKKVKDLKIGEYFVVKPLEYPIERQVFIRACYDRTEKKYYCRRFDDINAWYLMKGDRLVYVDFIF